MSPLTSSTRIVVWDRAGSCRVCTTVVNAYVGPALNRYLTRLETRLREAGFSGPVLIIQSHGDDEGIVHRVRLIIAANIANGEFGFEDAARMLFAARAAPTGAFLRQWE